ncbi:hypothetical protein GGX14DRAFT_521824 [Mycena pura]|uniref:F-box domain-containing protein n=1 Tax=Mycena pura TaxID=153505 RepID=A0AAD6YA62_9AGAR|nr:hypothetical protein GGX14DRAFT_521824 [Mycena pura]
MLDTLPPEILARVLEIAVQTWGVAFLPPVCLVSSTCNDVVVSTPSLWGVIVVNKRCSFSLLNRQLAKAKATDLRISLHKRTNNKHARAARRLMSDLVALSNNWVQAEISINLLSMTKWAELGRLQVLDVRFHDHDSGGSADDFFGSEHPARAPSLHSLTAWNLPEEWVTRFLSPRISYFQYGGFEKQIPHSTVIRYLSLTPNVHTLHLLNMQFPRLSESQAITLPNLHNLELDRIHNITTLLVNTCAPALRVLSIRDCKGRLRSFFSDWSQPKWLPQHLQSLELSHCVSSGDIPFLISWLARLPSLLRLIITQYAEFDSAEKELLRALASPNGAGPPGVVRGWLCPSLTHLCLDASLRMEDILPIARARGGAVPRAPGLSATLRSMQAPLCASGTAEEVVEFRSCFVQPEDLRCLCLSCSFNITCAYCATVSVIHKY